MSEDLDLYRLDDLISAEDKVVRGQIRHRVQSRFVPQINRCWNAGTFPLELLPEIAELGVFGANIQGYGCAGWSPLRYGLALAELRSIALQVARTAREILGGVGILDEHVSFRHMCNLESVYTYEGTDDMHLLILGEFLTGLSAFA